MQKVWDMAPCKLLIILLRKQTLNMKRWIINHRIFIQPISLQITLILAKIILMEKKNQASARNIVQTVSVGSSKKIQSKRELIYFILKCLESFTYKNFLSWLIFKLLNRNNYHFLTNFNVSNTIYFILHPHFSFQCRNYYYYFINNKTGT